MFIRFTVYLADIGLKISFIKMFKYVENNIEIKYLVKVQMLPMQSPVSSACFFRLFLPQSAVIGVCSYKSCPRIYQHLLNSIMGPLV